VGKGPIGFANPTLYANPQMFNDITVGDQSLGGCGTNGFSYAPVRITLINEFNKRLIDFRRAGIP
jgi:hypothetical protein